EVMGEDVNGADQTARGFDSHGLKGRKTPNAEVARGRLYTVIVELKCPFPALGVRNARQVFWRYLGPDGQRAAIFKYGLAAFEFHAAVCNVHSRLPGTRNGQPNPKISIRKLRHARSVVCSDSGSLRDLLLLTRCGVAYRRPPLTFLARCLGYRLTVCRRLPKK